MKFPRSILLKFQRICLQFYSSLRCTKLKQAQFSRAEYIMVGKAISVSFFLCLECKYKNSNRHFFVKDKLIFEIPIFQTVEY